jgi:hypothetical protein
MPPAQSNCYRHSSTHRRIVTFRLRVAGRGTPDSFRLGLCYLAMVSLAACGSGVDQGVAVVPSASDGHILTHAGIIVYPMVSEERWGAP